MIGNHEYFLRQEDMSLSNEAATERFVSNMGLPSLYYHKEIKGFDFIGLATEGVKLDGTVDGLANAIMSETQFQWLENKLLSIKDTEDYNPNKPIFVFFHYPIDDTVYGSERFGAGVEISSRLKEILSQYPQVIFFSGHTHYVLNHPRFVYQDKFTMVNAGSTYYGWTNNGDQDTSQGLLVDVYENQVEIKAIDFNGRNTKVINSVIVKLPYEQEQAVNDTVAPNFESKDYTIDNVSRHAVTFTFNHANDNIDENSMLDQYVYKINDEIVLKEHLDLFFHPNDSSKHQITITSLEPATEYTMEIIAIDTWMNESEPLVIQFTTSAEGWEFENGNWYYYNEKNERVTGHYKVDGYVYYFSEEFINYGVMLTGWQYINNHWYYFNENGMMQTGPVEIGGVVYQFNENGQLIIGWFYDGGNWYYLNEHGYKETGWLLEDGTWYYLNNQGVMQTGWLLEGNTWYYLESNGAMAIGWLYIGSSWYYLDETGAMQTGWLYQNGTWYYLNKQGVMQTGWLLQGNSWYYLKNNGAMVIGWVFNGGNWYYMNNNGMMQTGWLYNGGNWYYLKNSGEMAIGWLFDGTNWYYMDNKGAMFTGWLLENDQWYYFNVNGIWIN